MAIEIRWTPILGLPINFDKWKIEKSSTENGPYVLETIINMFDAQGNVVTSWFDPDGDSSLFFLIRGHDPTTGQDTDFTLGFFPLTPREQRLSDWVMPWLPDVIREDVTPGMMNFAFRLSVGQFNRTSPTTNYSIQSMPTDFDNFLVMGAQVNLGMNFYLKLSIRDMSYNDMGFSLNIDRGTKIKTAIEGINSIYTNIIKEAKWTLAPMGIGLGSIPVYLNTGMGLGRNQMNILDSFTRAGR